MALLANSAPTSQSSSSSQRPVAMFLALIFAIVLSPLYMDDGRRRNGYTRHETRLGHGFVLPVVLAGLIIAIRTTSAAPRRAVAHSMLAPEPSWVLRIGGSSWGLAGVLVMLMFVLSWQDSVHHFFWN